MQNKPIGAQVEELKALRVMDNQMKKRFIRIIGASIKGRGMACTI